MSQVVLNSIVTSGDSIYVEYTLVPDTPKYITLDISILPSKGIFYEFRETDEKSKKIKKHHLL